MTYAISTFGAGQGDSTTYLDDVQAYVIPEPATAGLVAVGLLGLARSRRRS